MFAHTSVLFSKDVFHHRCLTNKACLCINKSNKKKSPNTANIHAFLIPNDSLFYDQNAHNQFIDFGSQKLIETAGNYLFQLKLHKAWEITKGSEDIIIAVIDSGINPNHEDLIGKVVGGYNVITGLSTISDYTDSSNSLDPSKSFHGTKVASIAAANTNNNLGIAGAGFNSKLYAIRNVNTQGSSAPSNLTTAIQKVKDLVTDESNPVPIKVICISAGYSSPANENNDPVDLSESPYLELQSAINEVTQAGVTVVAAAGNKDTYGTWNINGESRKQFPACLDNVITVGGAAGTVYAQNFSLYGNRVDVIAPYMIRKAAYYDEGSRYTGLEAGTSFSAPLVAGVVALMYAYNTDATPAMIEYALINSAIDKGPIGYDIYNGHGFVDSFKALAYVDPISPNLSIIEPTSPHNLGDPLPIQIQVNDNFTSFLNFEPSFLISDLIKATLNYTQTLTDNTTLSSQSEPFFYQSNTNLFTASIMDQHRYAASISYNIELCDLNPSNNILVYGSSDILIQDLKGPRLSFPLSTYIHFSNPILIGITDNTTISANSLSLSISQADISETYRLTDDQNLLRYISDSNQLQVDLTADDNLFQLLQSDKPLSMYIDVMDVSNNATYELHTFEQSTNLTVLGADLSDQFFNSPNPFDPHKEATSICFELSQVAIVRIEIYSLYLGLVKTVFQGPLSEGYHQIDWNGRDASNRLVTNGVYIAVLHAKQQDKEVKKTCKIAVLRR